MVGYHGNYPISLLLLRYLAKVEKSSLDQLLILYLSTSISLFNSFTIINSLYEINYLGNVSAICLATRFIAPLMSADALNPKVVYAPRHEAIGRPVR